MRQLKITQSITNRGAASLDKYLQEISKIPMIGIEEEIQLTRAIRAGDELALNKLARANLRFVVSVAKQYQFRGMAQNDLIDEGNIGLMNAAKRFDETKGFKFISYAVWWIRQSIIQAIGDKARLVRLPSNRIGLGMKVQKMVSQFEQEHERVPSTEEISDGLKMPVDELTTVADYGHHYVSLDAPLTDDGDGNMADMIIDEDAKSTDSKLAHTQSLKIEVQRVLGTLTEKQRDIVCDYFGIGVSEPLSTKEIGKKYDMTGERVRQIKDRAISQLRMRGKTKLLKAYLGG